MLTLLATGSGFALVENDQVEVFHLHNGFSTPMTTNSVVLAGSDGLHVMAVTPNSHVYQDLQVLNTNPFTGLDTAKFHSIVRKPINGPRDWSLECNGTIISMASASDGGVVIAGVHSGTLQLRTFGTNAFTGSGGSIFLARFFPNGTLAWARVGTALGQSPSPSNVTSMAVDSQGNVAMVGRVNDSMKGEGSYIARYDFNGVFMWQRSYFTEIETQTRYFRLTATQLDKDGGIYFAGQFVGTQIVNDDITIVSRDLVIGDIVIRNTDMVIGKFDRDGNLLWAGRVGAVYEDMVTMLHATENGLIVAGTFNHQCDFPVVTLYADESVADPTQPNKDSFVAWMNSSGEWLSGLSFSGAKNQFITGIGSDTNRNTYVSGNFQNTVTVGTNLYTASGQDAFMARFNVDGNITRAWHFGGAQSQEVNGLVAADDGEVFFWGKYQSQMDIRGSVWTPAGGPGPASFYARIPAPRKPVITQPPIDAGALLGQSLTLSVGVTGTDPFTFQWSRNNIPIPGANSDVYPIPVLTVNDLGNYVVTITNEKGSVSNAPVSVSQHFPPQFTLKPSSAGGAQGGTLNLSATSTGVPAPVVQWAKEGGPVLHTGNTFTLSPLSFSDEGIYTVTATSTAGTVSETFHVGVDMIPSADFEELVHDPYRDIVYLTAGTNVLRYSMTTKQYLTPYPLGGDLRGLDISPDGKYLLVADYSGTTQSNWVHRINLETDVLTKLSFARAALENFTESVTFGGDGRAIISSNNRLRSVDPVTGEAIELNRSNAYKVARGANRQTLALAVLEPGNGNLHRYSIPQTNVLAASHNEGRTLIDAAVDRTENQFAAVSQARATFLGPAMQVLLSLGDGVTDGPLGAAYHPRLDLVYLPWMNTPEVRAYETATFTEVARYGTGTTPYVTGGNNKSGRAHINLTGDLLFVTSTYGVRYIRLPVQLPAVLTPPVSTLVSPGLPANFSVNAHSAYTLAYQWQKDGEDIPQATTRQLTVTASDATAGQYRVRITNGAGSIYSPEAQLSILKQDPGVVWNALNAITYGTLLSSSQLKATAAVPGTFTYFPPAGTLLNAGTHTLTTIFTPADTENYETVMKTVNLTVAKRSLTVSVANASRQYGLPDPAFTLSYSGFVNNETAAVLDVPPVGNAGTSSASPVGNYTIILSGGSDNNYFYNYGQGTLSITKRQVTFTLADLEQAYNGSPRPVTITADPADSPLAVTYNGGSTAPSARGTYNVFVTATGANHQGSTTGVLNIIKGTPQVTWNTPGAITYGTALSAAQLNATASLLGVNFYTPGSGTVVGAGNQTLSVVFTPQDSANYNKVTNTVTLQVNQKPLSITVNSATRAYGLDNPIISGNITGLLGTDASVVTVNYSPTATAASPVGDYGIAPVYTDPNNRLANYSITVTPGVLTVTKAALTIRADHKTRPYGGANPALTATYTGLRSGDVIPLSLVTTAGLDSLAGVYPITASLTDAAGLPTSNYTVTLEAGTLTVTQDEDQLITFAATPLAYLEGSGSQLLDPLVLVADNGLPDYSQGRLTLRVLTSQSSEQLSILPQGSGPGEIDLVGNSLRRSGTVIGLVNGTGASDDPLIIDFTTAVTYTQATEVMRRVAYVNSSRNPAPLTRAVEATLADGLGGISDPSLRSIQITPVNDAPTADWVSPAAVSGLKAGQAVWLEASASDVDNNVTKVEFWSGGSKLGEATTSPYRLFWLPGSAGMIEVQAIARDAAGAYSSPATRNLTFDPAMSTPRFLTGAPANFTFEFHGVPGLEYLIETSSDLLTWSPLVTVTATNGAAPVVDANAFGNPRRFYRIVPKP